MVVLSVIVPSRGRWVEVESVRRDLDHQHDRLHTQTYHDGRQQSDHPCRRRCGGVARVQMGYAPDRGRNWWKCCCCGDEYV